MDVQRLRSLLDDIAAGRVTPDAAIERLRALPYEDLDDLKLDHHRSLRTGFPETVYGAGKSPEQIGRAGGGLAGRGSAALVTRLDATTAQALRARHPEGVWHEAARIFELPAPAPVSPSGLVLVVAAGTSDLPVAEEAAVTARAFGARVETIHDAGVSGLHRLLSHRARLADARVIVVVAGMEGALPSVIGGLVSGVVIAVPTSVGYGASFGGVAALLGMLNSCAAGVLVCNIDNGHGAGIAAARISRLVEAGPVGRGGVTGSTEA